MVDIKDIADIIILYCQLKGFKINPIKLQKLLYFVQVWHIVEFEKDPLFKELPEAWVNGPVYRIVYDMYKEKFYRNENFKADADEVELHEQLNERISKSNLTAESQKLLFDVLDVCGSVSEIDLVFATHNADPWINARKGLEPFERCNNVISVDDMYNYYSKK